MTRRRPRRTRRAGRRPALGTRDALLATAVDLVRAARAAGDVTVRRVVEAAGANLNAVNYHFGSKQELVREAVRAVIGDWFRARGLGPEGAEGEGPLSVANLATSFLFEEPVASRLALDAELETGGGGRSLTREALEGIARELGRARPRLETGEVRLRAWLLTAAMHQLFLRPEDAREWLDLDASDPGAREALLERVLLLMNPK